VPGPGTRKRGIRISDALWKAALAAAKDNGEYLADVVRRDLIRYVRDYAREPTAAVIVSLLEYIAKHGDAEERKVVRALLERRAN